MAHQEQHIEEASTTIVQSQDQSTPHDETQQQTESQAFIPDRQGSSDGLEITPISDSFTPNSDSCTISGLSADTHGGIRMRNIDHTEIAQPTNEVSTTNGTPNSDMIDDDGFVIVDPERTYRLENHKESFYTQMETYLVNQMAKCEYYKNYFEKQTNVTMANMFNSYLMNSKRDLELLRLSMRNKDAISKYKFESVNFSCLPINIDVKEKELQLVVRALKLPVIKNAQVYIIGEFSFSSPNDEPMTNTIYRWLHHVKVDPKTVLCCSDDASRQLDMVYSTDRVPFTSPSSEYLEFERPLSFYVTKGKSRTHKRKFKPIKLTFYEKTNLLKCDKKIGSVTIKVDAINDDISVSSQQNLMEGRKQLDALIDVKVKVRRPLVETTIRAHEEQLLILT